MQLLLCYPTAWHGADLDTRVAQAPAAVPQLADEPELSHALVGLTDKLLSVHQYGQTILVTFGPPPLPSCVAMCTFVTWQLISYCGDKYIHCQDLVGSCLLS